MSCVLILFRHGLPFKFVEYEEVRTWITNLNPGATLVSINTIKSDVLRIFMREKYLLKGELISILSRICLTSDLWTSCTIEAYICLTTHYVGSNWNLSSKILNFCHLPPLDIGFELCKKINEFLHDEGLKKNYFPSLWTMLIVMIFWSKP